MNFTSFLITLIFLSGVLPARAVTSAWWYNSEATAFRDISGAPLFGAGNYAGDVVELGYYTLATTHEPFAGDWEVLMRGSIGSKSVSFLLPGVFAREDAVRPPEILAGTPLSIRFYDATSRETPAYFNAVSDVTGAWNWFEGSGEITLSLADSRLVWQDGFGSAFRTTIPVPETGSVILLAGGFLAFLVKRRRGPRAMKMKFRN
ncbi:MAG: hypothetical protein V4726_10160 [Verrucomicrobiota bacterium]